MDSTILKNLVDGCNCLTNIEQTFQISDRETYIFNHALFILIALYIFYSLIMHFTRLAYE